MDIMRFLADIEIFSLMDGEDLKLMASRAKIINYTEGQFIIRQGEKTDSLWVIHGGRAKVIKERGGQKETVAVLMPGEVFGEMSTIRGKNATADVVPVGKVTAIQIPGDLFKEVLDRSTISMGKMAQTMTRRFFDLMKK